VVFCTCPAKFVNANAGGRLAVEPAVVCMSVESERSVVAVNDFGEA